MASENNSNKTESKKDSEKIKRIELDSFIDKKIKNFGFDFNVAIGELDGETPSFDNVIGVQKWEDPETGNVYLRRKIKDNGEDKYLFYERYPERAYDTEKLLNEKKKIEKQLNYQKKYLQEIESKESKTREKLNVNKSTIRKEIVEFERKMIAMQRNPKANFRVRFNGKPTFFYLKIYGVYYPLIWDPEILKIGIVTEEKRDHYELSHKKTEETFKTEKKFDWSKFGAYLILLILIAGNIYVFFKQMDGIEDSTFTQLKEQSIKDNSNLLEGFNNALSKNVETCAIISGIAPDELKNRGLVTQVQGQNSISVE